MVTISDKSKPIIYFASIAIALGTIPFFVGAAFAQQDDNTGEAEEEQEMLATTDNNNNSTVERGWAPEPMTAEELAEQDGEGGNIVLEPGEQDPYSPPEPGAIQSTTTNNQNIDPRLFASQSVEMQDYETLLNALLMGGLKFTESGVTYTKEADGGGNKVIIEGTAGVFGQPPQMAIEGIVDDFGWDVDTYAPNPVGELLVELEEAF